MVVDTDLATYDEEVLIWRESGAPPGTTAVPTSGKNDKLNADHVHNKVREVTYISAGAGTEGGGSRALAIVELKRKSKKQSIGVTIRHANGRHRKSSRPLLSYFVLLAVLPFRHFAISPFRHLQCCHFAVSPFPVVGLCRCPCCDVPLLHTLSASVLVGIAHLLWANSGDHSGNYIR
jgi:hypothetical protein